jgi:hypothetical protein
MIRRAMIPRAMIPRAIVRTALRAASLAMPVALLVALFIALPAASLRAQLASIAVDTSVRFQTMHGWEATTQSGEDYAGFPAWRDELFDRAVDELGIDRVRLQVRSGSEYDRDTWTEYRNGTIDYATWRAIRYATVNDNADPFVIDPDGFHFAMLDSTVVNVVLPLKRRLETRGEHLWINVNYVAFTGQITSAYGYTHDDSPEEYAEFVLATVLHLRDRFGFVPDSWEMILEPDNTAFWRGRTIGEALAASARRLAENGIPMRFIAPSTTNMGNAPAYFDAMIAVPGVLASVSELSYHRYGGVKDSTLREIAARSTAHGISTSMLEHIGSGYEDLYKDLALGNASAWQQFTLAFPSSTDDGGKYYLIDTTAAGGPRVVMGNRTRYLAQYFRHVRAGAVRVGATSSRGGVEPLAFVNADGRAVVVVKTAGGATLAVSGLPAGRYRVTSTTASTTAADGGTFDVAPGGSLSTSIAAAGVVTIAAERSTSSVELSGRLPLQLGIW